MCMCHRHAPSVSAAVILVCPPLHFLSHTFSVQLTLRKRKWEGGAESPTKLLHGSQLDEKGKCKQQQSSLNPTLKTETRRLYSPKQVRPKLYSSSLLVSFEYLVKFFVCFTHTIPSCFHKCVDAISPENIRKEGRPSEDSERQTKRP